MSPRYYRRSRWSLKRQIYRLRKQVKSLSQALIIHMETDSMRRRDDMFRRWRRY